MVWLSTQQALSVGAVITSLLLQIGVGRVSGFVSSALPQRITVVRDSNAKSGRVRSPHLWDNLKNGFRRDELPADDGDDAIDVYASRMTKDDYESNKEGRVLETTAQSSIKVQNRLLEKLRAQQVKSLDEVETDYDVVIVGAGVSGLGVGLMLTRTFGLDSARVLIVEKGKKVGDSFRKWPEEMRFISPSFNMQGWTKSFDLNAIHYDTSPAVLLTSEHPSGFEYALYLEAIAERGGLNVQLETKVVDISETKKDEKEKDERPGFFNIETKDRDGMVKTLSSKFVVWAAGEFQFPKEKRTVAFTQDKDTGERKTMVSMFQGANLCVHNSRVQSWASLPEDGSYVIIGGYESGIDAAVNLAKSGKKCTVLASTPTWSKQTFDPSSELAVYTAGRLREVMHPSFSGPNPELLSPVRVIAVEEAKEGGYNIAAKWQTVQKNAVPNKKGLGFEVQEPGEAGSIITFHSEYPPILATGFEGSVAAEASHLFAFPDPTDKKGCIGNGPLLTAEDESVLTQGVFLVGPSVTHGELSFCFVYKFRQRFAVVASAICQRLGMNTEKAIAECRQTDMFLDNFATCEGICDC